MGAENGNLESRREPDHGLTRDRTAGPFTAGAELKVMPEEPPGPGDRNHEEREPDFHLTTLRCREARSSSSLPSWASNHVKADTSFFRCSGAGSRTACLAPDSWRMPSWRHSSRWRARSS